MLCILTESLEVRLIGEVVLDNFRWPLVQVGLYQPSHLLVRSEAMPSPSVQLADKTGNLAFALRSAYQRHLLQFEQELTRTSSSQLPAAKATSSQSDSQPLASSRLVPKSTVRSSRGRGIKRKLDCDGLGPAAAAGILYELVRNDELPEGYQHQADVAKSLGVRVILNIQCGCFCLS